jgi:hypothetical protein
VHRAAVVREGVHIAPVSTLTSDTLTGGGSPRRQAWLWVVVAAWLATSVFGLRIVWAYDNTPGVLAQAPQRWPAASALVLSSGQPTLVVFAHPQCPCTRASLGELAEVLARAPRPLTTHVVFLKPAAVADGWERTALWDQAARLPGANAVRDDGGAEARLFGVQTSGQVLLYDSAGRLRFNGGITGSRGHAGDNAGRAALVALIGATPGDRTGAGVFGCPLLTPGSVSQ